MSSVLRFVTSHGPSGVIGIAVCVLLKSVADARMNRVPISLRIVSFPPRSLQIAFSAWPSSSTRRRQAGVGVPIAAQLHFKRFDRFPHPDADPHVVERRLSVSVP